MNSISSGRRAAIRNLRSMVAVLIGGGLLSVQVHAAQWPEKPLTIIVPYAPGGGTDALARLMASELGTLLHQTVIIDNKPGARGVVAYQALLRNTGDPAYTFLLDNSSFAVQPLYKGLPYDPLASIRPVARITISPTVLIINKDTPTKTFTEFIAYAKQSPGKVAFASYGIGSSSHLSGELLNNLTSAGMLHVPYKGSGPALTDLLGGQVQAMFSDPMSAKPLMDAGKVRAIAISGYERAKAFADTPTYRELGLDAMSSPGWWGIVASAKASPDIANKMSDAVKTVLSSATVRERIRDLGAEVSPLGPVEFSEFVKSDVNRWVKVVQAGHIDLDAGVR